MPRAKLVFLILFIKKLKSKGYERVARKDIYDDVNVLNKFYEDSYGNVLKTVPRIEREEGTWGYYMDNRPLSFAALKLVIDSIQSSKFLSEAKTIELIDVLETFCSVHQAKGFSTCSVDLIASKSAISR